MNKAALARAKEAAEAEAGRPRGELADSKAATAAAQREAASSAARAAAAEASLAELLAAVAASAHPRLDCSALPAEVWAEVLSAVGASR